VGVAMRMALASLWLLATPALAHEAGERARGTVESITADRIVLEAADGHELAYAITPETRFLRGDARIERAEVRVGERAVVQGKKGKDGMEATRVTVGAARQR